MKVSELNNLIENITNNEFKKAILEEMEKGKKEVYHIKCEGVPLATFPTEEEAMEQLPKYKAKHKGELIIEKGVYDSHDEMMEKFDEMNDELEEMDNMKNTQMDEKLVGKQSKLDKNHNGKIDAQDFKILKGQKEKEVKEADYKRNSSKKDWKHFDANDKELKYEPRVKGGYSIDKEGKRHEVTKKEDQPKEFRPGVDLGKAFEKFKKMKDMKEEDEDGKDVYSIWEKYSEEAMKENDPSNFSDEFEYADNVINDIVQSAIGNGDVREEDEDELTDELKDTYGYDLFDSFKSANGEDDEEIDMDENKHVCNECGGELNEEGMCNECGYGSMKESKKRVVRLTETQLIDTIKKIVSESVPGLREYKKAHDASGKSNKSSVADVSKKMKDYLTFDGNDNPEFPNQVKKGDKMAINNTKEEDEFVDKERGRALQDLKYDHEPSENFKKRMKMAIEGDKLMGNESKDAGNVVPKKETSEKILKGVKNKKEELDNRVLYNKERVPVKTVNESKGKLRSILDEEVDRIMKIQSYNKKTQ